MKRKRPLVFPVVVTVIALASLLANARQWQQRRELQTAAEIAQRDVADLEGLRTENRALREKQISPEELARLRNDHAALPRLRAEVRELRSRKW